MECSNARRRADPGVLSFWEKGAIVGQILVGLVLGVIILVWGTHHF